MSVGEYKSERMNRLFCRWFAENMMFSQKRRVTNSLESVDYLNGAKLRPFLESIKLKCP
jgi:hypothetical protein